MPRVNAPRARRARLEYLGHHSRPVLRGYNHLPYRMLLPRRATCGGVVNLLVAGRCSSMTHDGQSAARVSGACFVMGQAAGTAAAMSVRQNCAPFDIDVKELQRLLLSQGAFLGAEAGAPNATNPINPAGTCHSSGQGGRDMSDLVRAKS